jgi:hypothetical protein
MAGASCVGLYIFSFRPAFSSSPPRLPTASLPIHHHHHPSIPHQPPTMRSTLLLATLSLLAPSLAYECNGFGSASNPGDTCESFAKQWKITVDELKRLNPDVRCPDLEYRNYPYCLRESETTTSSSGSTSTSSDSSSTVESVLVSSTSASATPPVVSSGSASGTTTPSASASGSAAPAQSSAAPSGSGAEARAVGSFGLVAGVAGVFALL